jgi:hypothetical protein
VNTVLGLSHFNSSMDRLPRPVFGPAAATLRVSPPALAGVRSLFLFLQNGEATGLLPTC